MNILQVAPQVPWPPEDGGKVGIFNITRHLTGRGHRITLFGFDRAPGTDYAPLRKYCDLVAVGHSTGNSIVGAALNLFSDIPYTVSKYRSRRLLDQLMEFARNNPVDVVHVDHLHMAAYGVELKRRLGLPIVLREHNVESVIVERFAATAPNPAVRAYARMQHGRAVRYEAAMAGEFDACCPITPDDAERLRSMSPRARLTVVPGGVESSYFAPADPARAVPGSIVFFGALDWVPNRDAVAWFLDDVFPRVLAAVPSATFTIVGKDAPADLVRRAGPRCAVLGYVADLRAEIQRHAVSIAPFRIGGGMRLKIIESFAMGVPVVSTSVGCEGIEGRDGEHLLVGDTPGAFAERVAAVLADPAAGRRLAENAFRLASERYRWEKVAEMLEGVYLGAAGGGGGKAVAAG